VHGRSSRVGAGAARIVYGALGWFGFNGESRFNIAIRTMVVESGKAHFHVGAGLSRILLPTWNGRRRWIRRLGFCWRRRVGYGNLGRYLPERLYTAWASNVDGVAMEM
jgi:hypothetical protein